MSMVHVSKEVYERELRGAVQRYQEQKKLHEVNQEVERKVAKETGLPLHEVQEIGRSLREQTQVPRRGTGAWE